MKTKIAIILFMFINTLSVSATAYLYANYSSGDVQIRQFLGFHSQLDERNKDPHQAYLDMEEKFHLFCYLTDVAVEICSRTGKQLSFYSQIDGAKLVVGEKQYRFAPSWVEKHVDNFSSDYIFPERYNDPNFIIPFVCEDLGIEIPLQKTEGRMLYSLETTSKLNPKIEEAIEYGEYDEDTLIFFLPSGDVSYSPCFELNSKKYIGFYYSKNDAIKMQKILQDKYSVYSTVKNFPLDFSLINEAFFSISKRK